VEKPSLLAKQTSSGTSTQPESVEGGTQPQLAGQLAEIGHQVGLVHRVLPGVSDHRLFYGHPVKDLGLKDFWDWFLVLLVLAAQKVCN
jgi:hypothetical protein